MNMNHQRYGFQIDSILEQVNLIFNLIKIKYKLDFFMLEQKQIEYVSQFKERIDYSFQQQGSHVALCDKYQRGRMSDKDAQYIAKHHSLRLRSIDLRWNNFTGLGMKYLSTAKWQYLQTVSLDSNRINSKGCKYIATVIFYIYHSQCIIQVGENIINDAGVQHLTKAKWPLQNFSAGNNRIGDDGLKYIAKAKWNRLNWLHIQDNPFTQVGAQYVVLWDGEMTRSQMDYRYNNVSKWCKQKVLKAIKKRYNLDRGVFV